MKKNPLTLFSRLLERKSPVKKLTADDINPNAMPSGPPANAAPGPSTESKNVVSLPGSLRRTSVNQSFYNYFFQF